MEGKPSLAKKKPESSLWFKKKKNKHRVLLLGGERQRWGGILRINTVGLVQGGKFI